MFSSLLTGTVVVVPQYAIYITLTKPSPKKGQYDKRGYLGVGGSAVGMICILRDGPSSGMLLGIGSLA